ncbi:MAG: DNA primase small subunit PriS [Candidatus Bathyarchaeia archaeon]
MTSLTFVQEIFRKYYVEQFPSTISIPLIEKREFGFLFFENQMVRHRSFPNVEELRIFMQNFVPSDVYYSCAYYENPTLEMDRKNWLGADLIFDIDADHILTQCERVHDMWVCCSCGFSGKGITPEKCPLCGGEKFDVETWPCEVCLDSAKLEALKLLDILQADFGLSKGDMRVFFSGHRGYHVHVECEDVKLLDSIARKEIVDYVCGVGMDLSFHLTFDERSLKKKVSLFDHGLSKRLIDGFQAFLMDAREDDLKKLNFRKNVINAILQNKNVLLKNLLSGMRRPVKGVGSKTIMKLMGHVLTMRSAKIDTVVTTDVHRLIRMPETLNSKTGFKKAEVPISKIDTFDPFKDAVAFKEGEVKVNVMEAPRFRIGDEIFGPYRDKKVELPLAAALLLICRGRAEVLNNV